MIDSLQRRLDSDAVQKDLKLIDTSKPSSKVVPPTHAQTTVLSSSECSLPLVDSQKLLVDLATKIVDSASAIEVQIFHLSFIRLKHCFTRRFWPWPVASRTRLIPLL